jgi:hypothetical protein
MRWIRLGHTILRTAYRPAEPATSSMDMALRAAGIRHEHIEDFHQ